VIWGTATGLTVTPHTMVVMGGVVHDLVAGGVVGDDRAEINAATGSATNAPMGPAMAPPASAAPNATPPLSDIVSALIRGLNQ
jgi:hypothetical protein